MEAICSSETSADFQRTTRRYSLEDITVHKISESKLYFPEEWSKPFLPNAGTVDCATWRHISDEITLFRYQLRYV
jgi:hypothetical protein